MSIKLMSEIFEAKFHDLEYVKDSETRKAKASTCKLVLLAIADHANDYGESSYPGYDKLVIKTALSKQGLADTLDALKYNGLLMVDEKPSRLHTNNYTININAIRESSHLTRASQATLLEGVKSLDHNHPLTTIKPKQTYKAQTPDPDNRDVVGTPDFRNMSITEVLHVPEIQAFKEATGWTPGSFVCETVYAAMRSGIDKEALRAAFNAWCARGYKPANVAGYLEWARHGIPDQKQYNNKGNKSSVQNDLDKLQKWVEEGA